MINSTVVKSDRVQVQKIVVKGDKKRVDAPMPCLPRYGW